MFVLSAGEGKERARLLYFVCFAIAMFTCLLIITIILLNDILNDAKKSNVTLKAKQTIAVKSKEEKKPVGIDELKRQRQIREWMDGEPDCIKGHYEPQYFNFTKIGKFMPNFICDKRR